MMTMTKPRSMSTELRRLLPAPGVEGRAGEVGGRVVIAAVFTVLHVRDGFVMELFRRRELIGRNSAYTVRGLPPYPAQAKRKSSTTSVVAELLCSPSGRRDSNP